MDSLEQKARDKNVRKSLRLMQSAISAFDKLPHSEDRWFVLSNLIRKYPQALQEALNMTPEVSVR